MGAGLYQGRELLGTPAGLEAGVVLVGVAAALLSSLAAIWLLLALVARVSFWPFVLYRVALGGVVLLVG